MYIHIYIYIYIYIHICIEAHLRSKRTDFVMPPVEAVAAVVRLKTDIDR